MDCGFDKAIHIISSTYGRINGVSCADDAQDPSGAATNIGCEEKYGLRVVEDKCEGVRRCSVDVKAEKFELDEDPLCSHVSHKYLRVTYGCIQRKSNVKQE